MSQCKCGASVTHVVTPDGVSLALESYDTTTGERYAIDYDARNHDFADRPIAEPLDELSGKSGSPPHAPQCPFQQ
jgi:hypothetical protein